MPKSPTPEQAVCEVLMSLTALADEYLELDQLAMSCVDPRSVALLRGDQRDLILRGIRVIRYLTRRMVLAHKLKSEWARETLACEPEWSALTAAVEAAKAQRNGKAASAATPTA